MAASAIATYRVWYLSWEEDEIAGIKKWTVDREAVPQFNARRNS